MPTCLSFVTREPIEECRHVAECRYMKRFRNECGGMQRGIQYLC